jgi:hypothetical protein
VELGLLALDTASVPLASKEMALALALTISFLVTGLEQHAINVKRSIILKVSVTSLVQVSLKALLRVMHEEHAQSNRLELAVANLDGVLHLDAKIVTRPLMVQNALFAALVSF